MTLMLFLFQLSFGSQVATASKFSLHCRALWLGTSQGELLRCTWSEGVFSTESDTPQNVQIMDHSVLHDGPLLDIARCPDLGQVLLTIGGAIFALWKDDRIESPLMWRKRRSTLTGCCWSNRPGVFLLGNVDGRLEIWNVMGDSARPEVVQTVSLGPLGTLRRPLSRQRVLAVCDNALGAIRIFEELEEAPQVGQWRIDSFEEYVWRELKKKMSFQLWQEEFLKNVEKATTEGPKEGLARLEAEKLLLKKREEKMPSELEKRTKLTKESEKKKAEVERMKRLLLRKNKLKPKELEKTRAEVVLEQEKYESKLEKARVESNMKEEHFQSAVITQVPEVRDEDVDTKDSDIFEGSNVFHNLDYEDEYAKLRVEMNEIIGKRCRL